MSSFVIRRYNISEYYFGDTALLLAKIFVQLNGTYSRFTLKSPADISIL